jgi:hypothetical protein
MNKQDIEARLDRSLASQLRVPKLDRRFDAGVWARIEAEQRARQPAAAMPSALAPVGRPAKAAQRWLFASNVAGFIVAAILVAYFGMRMLGGITVEMPAVPVPSLSLEETGAMIKLISWAISGVALAFGLMFTPLGRRVRSEFT